ncbi:MAG: hypothetical protein M0R48_05720 [Candidatus Omnitrophica bacterium]|jgi:hypothetical protein|nr:hypothetical protein [Candidatus Omnitrophota bacterium]
MNLEYSPKERYNKIVEILAEGVISLIRYRLRLSAMLHKGMNECLSRIMDIMSKDKSVKSCAISGYFVEATIEKNKQKRYIEPFGKVYSFSQMITRD